MMRGGGLDGPSIGPVIERDRHGTDMHAMEAAARRVLATMPDWMWDGRPPVPVERIAEDRFGLRVIDVADPSRVPGAPSQATTAHLSGLLLPHRGEIWVHSGETSKWPPRRRFTIAHELGHWVLHRFSGKPAMCRATQLAGGRIDTGALPPADPAEKAKRPPLPIEEAEANAFAAALLLPATLVREEHARANGDITALMRAFDSSKAALERRLRTLGLEWVEPAA